MLNQNDLATWYARLNLNDQARTIIEQVRSSEPTRRVGGGHTNVSGFYPSRKMGKTIQFESHRVELAAIYEMEHDPLTLEFYGWLCATRQTSLCSGRTILDGKNGKLRRI